MNKLNLKKITSTILTSVLTFNIGISCLNFNVLAEGTEEENKETTQGVERKTEAISPYTIFAGSSDNKGGKVAINCIKSIINGNIYTDADFETSTSELKVNGSVDTTGKINNHGPNFSVETENENVEKQEMPDWDLNIMQKAGSAEVNNDELTKISEEKLKEFTLKTSGEVVIEKTDFDGVCYIISEKNITLDANNSKMPDGIVLYSKQGNIEVNGKDVNFKGIVYAPNGSVSFNNETANINGRIFGSNVNLNGNEFNVTSSEDDFNLIEAETSEYIFVAGQYDEENNCINLGWVSNPKSDSYKVLVSDDGENFEEAMTVTGATKYQYPLAGFWSEKYFKISFEDKNGKVIESDPFCVTDTEPGYSFKMSDTDEDGLSNLEEYKLAINPKAADTDNDGLSDKDEIEKYKTNPLVADTDNDKLNDGDDISLGFDPLNPDTDGNGVLDGDEFINQTVEEKRFDESLKEDNVAVPTALTVSAKGNVNSNMNVSEYTGHLKGDERSYVGKAIEISDSEINDGKLTFTLSDEYKIENYEISGEKTNGLIICYNNGEETVPLDTTYDEETRTLSAAINHEGIYFILDVVDWIETLDIDVSSIVENTEDSELLSDETVSDMIPVCLADISKTNKNSDVTIAQKNINGQVDIVFVIDTTSSMGGSINNVKNNINAFVDYLEEAHISSYFALVDYKDIESDGKETTRTNKNSDGGNWFKDAENFKEQISRLSVRGGGDTPESAIDALEMARQLDMRKSSQKFFILVTDAGYKIANNYGISSMEEMIEMLKNDEICVSVISGSGSKSTYRDLYEQTEGIFANIGGNFKNELLSIANKMTEMTNKGYWIALNGLIPQVVKLKAKPYSTTDSYVDTDNDGLSDDEELAGLASVPIDGFLRKLCPSLPVIKLSIPVYNYNSNPTKKDTDGDDLDDYAEDYIGTSPLSKKNVISFGGASDAIAKGAEAVPEEFERNRYFPDWYDMIHKHRWGYIHDAVVNDIIERYDEELDLESEQYLPNIIRRYDIHSRETNGVWDIKPSSYAPGLPNREKGIAQVNEYVEGLKRLAEIEPNNPKGDPKAHPGGTEIKGNKIVVGNYDVVYYNSGDGLILYSFKERKTVQQAQPVPVPKEKEAEEKNPAYKPQTTAQDPAFWGGALAYMTDGFKVVSDGIKSVAEGVKYVADEIKSVADDIKSVVEGIKSAKDGLFFDARVPIFIPKPLLDSFKKSREFIRQQERQNGENYEVIIA